MKNVGNLQQLIKVKVTSLVCVQGRKKEGRSLLRCDDDP